MTHFKGAIKVVLYWYQPLSVGWVGCFFVCVCFIGENPFLVGLVDQPFEPASNPVEIRWKSKQSKMAYNDYS